MALSKTPYAGTRIDYKIPCTSSYGRRCGIFRDVSQWNEFLWQCGLGLREHSPGELSLMIARDFMDDGNTRKVMHTTATRLHHLLTRHHCVTSMEIRVWMFWHHDPLMCDALRKSLSLMKLKLILEWSYFRRPPAHNFATALLHLNHLRELECHGDKLDRSFTEGLSEFLSSTRSLKTLNLTWFGIQRKEDAVAILQGLRRNQSNTTLSFNTSLLNPQLFEGRPPRLVSQRYANTAADYLRGNQTLRTLSVSRYDIENFSLVRPILETLISNHCLTKLSIQGLSLEDKDFELINRLLSHNRTLTSFNLTECDWDEAERQHGEDETNRSGNSAGKSSRISSILLALTRNKTLQELTLTSTWFNTDESRSFFKAVASHASLKKVSVDMSTRDNAVKIYIPVQEIGAQNRSISDRVLPENAVAFTVSKEPSGLSVGRHEFDEYAQLLATLSPQPSGSHVTSLWLLVKRELLNARVSSVIAQYIMGTTTLRDLKLRFDVTEVGDVVHEPRRELARALSVNKGERRLEVGGSWSDESETNLLADTLPSSRTLCHVSFFPKEHEIVTSLAWMLSPKISANYTLLSMSGYGSFLRGGHWFQVSEVIRRNCALVTRAVRFVIGTKVKYCAAALELVHSNSGLVQKVQELASVDEDEAASRIKESLKSMSELDDFMRLAGVVKYGVTCHSRDDGKKQLVDIGQDCWLHLRQFVKLGDILNE